MKKEIEKFKKVLYDCVSQSITANWENNIKTEIELISGLAILTELFLQRLLNSRLLEDIFNAYLEYNDKIAELIKNKGNGAEPLGDIPDFPLIYEAIDAILDKIPLKIKEEQSPDRFTLQPEDPVSIKSLKLIKSVSYHISILPLKLLNKLRILFKKEPLLIRYWYHTVLYQSLVKLHLKNQFLLDLEQYKYSINGRIASTINDVWVYLISTVPDVSELVSNRNISKDIHWKKTEEKLNDFIQRLKILSDRIPEDIKELIENRVSLLNRDYHLSGTQEYSNRLLKDGHLSKQSRKIELQWESNTKGWSNTYYALFDDWRSDIEIYALRTRLFSLTCSIGDMQNSDEYRFKEEFNTISQIFAEALNKLKSTGTELREVFNETKHFINKNLNKNVIPSFSNKMGSKNLSGLISKLENDVENSLELISNSHVVVKSENLTRPLKSNELETIAVSDLTSFEMLPQLKVNFSGIKNSLFLKLTEVNELILDLGNIAVFALETAVYNTEDPESNESESHKIALEGIQRAQRKADQIEKSIHDLYERNYDEILRSIQEFNAKLKSYTDNENALELKVRIVKSKAIEQSKKIRKEFKNKISNVIKHIGTRLFQLFRYSYTGLLKTRKRFLLTAPEPVLSREVSDFLSYSNKKIDGLPLLYKNLYKIQPIRDAELFVGRENEMQKLNNAYKNWLAGNYATTALIGEKWGGSTSLISNFIVTNDFKYKIHRININVRILDSTKLISLISSLAEIKENDDLDTLIEALNGLASKRIIILEDIQKIYLRKMNGFNSLKALFKLINKTNKNIFWLASCTVYAWNYLKNAISIHDYFSHIIMMEKLNEEQIVEIIKRRNRISGLNVIFESDNNNIIKKKLKGLSEEDQQSLLQKMYFDDLSDFSESNISLALIFWLLSTKEITESKLIIGKFEKPDLSFVRVISMERVLTLLGLILHDGLSESELSEVNNITIEESKLIVLMLLEDGIIYPEKDIYLINPIIYRNVIKLLKVKNLIQE